MLRQNPYAAAVVLASVYLDQPKAVAIRPDLNVLSVLVIEHLAHYLDFVWLGHAAALRSELSLAATRRPETMSGVSVTRATSPKRLW